MKLYVRLEAPYEWVRLDGIKVAAFGEVPGLADYPIADEDELIGVVPGEWVTVQHISLPAKSKRQFQAALPYALEETISEDLDQLQFICPAWKPNEECVVYVVAKRKLLEWRDLATEHQMPINRLVADHSLLPFHDSAECSLAVLSPLHAANFATGTDVEMPVGEVVLAKQQGKGGVSLDADFIDIWLLDVPMTSTIAINSENLTEALIRAHPDRDFRHWPFGNKMAHWLEHVSSSSSSGYDLFTDEYRPRVRKKSLRAFVVPLGLVAASVFLVFLYDTYRYLALHAEIRMIKAERQQIMRDTFPELGPVESSEERYMMEQVLLRKSGSSEEVGLQLMLAQVAKVVKAQKITLSNVEYREDSLQITCQLNDFSQVDSITKLLNARPRIKATLQSSAADDGEIIANFLIVEG